MVQFADGQRVTVLKEKIDPNDTVWLWVTWSRELGDGEEITSSSWVLPAGFTENGAYSNEAAQECGDVYLKSNAILLSTTQTSGYYEIRNVVTVSTGETLNGTIGFEVGAN